MWVSDTRADKSLSAISQDEELLVSQLIVNLSTSTAANMQPDF